MEIDPIEFSPEKDARYDGHFYRAILTTGIFCRPICPSRPARAENMLFFTTAAAAAEAGFRPCLRCRPESAPDRPEGVGVSRLVKQALRLITQDVAGKDLAKRLYVSPRQLRRRFVQELGAPPSAIIQTRKLLFAKKLLDETKLPMTDVAYCAGYTSVRRFNAAIRQTYNRTPTDIRNSRRKSWSTTDESTVQLNLFFRPPLNWTQLSRQLMDRANPQIELVSDCTYKRLVRFGSDVGWFTISPRLDQNHLLLTVSQEVTAHLLTITELCKRLFDLRTDPNFVMGHLSTDPLLVDRYRQHAGLRIAGAWDEFETAVQIVLRHQTNQEASSKMTEALIGRCGQAIQFENQAYTLFPTPQQILAADLKEIALPSHKLTAIRSLAAALLEGNLDWFTPDALPEIITALTALPEINEWMAHMIALLCFTEINAFPADDYQLREAVTPIGTPLLSPAALMQHAIEWEPFRGYAAHLLWKE
ncbi:MAG: AlkA N-terminal domain-containing protein [Chloroflexota bacterium]